jgi:hypothetical protein
MQNLRQALSSTLPCAFRPALVEALRLEDALQVWQACCRCAQSAYSPCSPYPRWRSLIALLHTHMAQMLLASPLPVVAVYIDTLGPCLDPPWDQQSPSALTSWLLPLPLSFLRPESPCAQGWSWQWPRPCCCLMLHLQACCCLKTQHKTVTTHLQVVRAFCLGLLALRAVSQYRTTAQAVCTCPGEWQVALAVTLMRSRLLLLSEPTEDLPKIKLAILRKPALDASRMVPLTA